MSKPQLVLQNLDAKLDGEQRLVSASSFAVIDESGRALFVLKLGEDGSLEVRSGEPVQRNGLVLSRNLVVAPLSRDGVSLQRAA